MLTLLNGRYRCPFITYYRLLDWFRIMKLIKERSLFLKSAFRNIHAVGSILPSSQVTARAMTKALRQRRPPRRILEVGAGTGPITARIVREMGPGDQLDIYEIDPTLASFLSRRFEMEAPFRQVKDQVRIYPAGIETIAREPVYDLIISAVPFTNLPPHLVETFFETYRAILRPGGTLTYIEFAFGRAVLQRLAKGPEKQRMQAVSEVVKRYNKSYQYRQHFVLLNAPPARVRSLRFDGGH